MVKDVARMGDQKSTGALRRLYKPAGFDTRNPLYHSFTLQWNEYDKEVLEVYGGECSSQQPMDVDGVDFVECDEQDLNVEEVQESVEVIRRGQQRKKWKSVAEAGSEEVAPDDSRVLHKLTTTEELRSVRDRCA